ncbi:MAG TPA: hypothetical protein VNJ07_00420 [Chitinophagales bacterium]|nr:hypothetical protein [Chitinophagales bacterium]
MKKSTHPGMFAMTPSVMAKSASSILKGEVLAFNSHSFNPIILPFFIRL